MEQLKTLTAQIHASIRADLLSCRIPPGEKLKINDLSAKYQVSLAVVREALTYLSAEGLVTAESQRGFKVPKIDAIELAELTDARIQIELLCMSRAMSVGGIDWESRITSTFQKMAMLPVRPPEDPTRLSDDYSQAHKNFHSAITSACTNRWLQKIRETLFDQSERYRRLSVPLQISERDLAKEHEEIMSAVLARNEKSAHDLMRAHLSRTTKILLDAGVCDR